MLTNKSRFIKIHTYINRYQIILVASFVLVFSTAWLFSEYVDYRHFVKKQNEFLLAKNKADLEHEVRKIIRIIDFLKTNHDINTAKERIIDLLAGYRLPHGGYVFVNQIDGKALIFDGKKVSNHSVVGMKDGSGTDLFELELDLYRLPEGGFMMYNFKKMNSFDEFEKISFIQGYPEFEWIIGAGNYLDEVLLESSSFLGFVWLKFVNRIGHVLILLILAMITVALLNRQISKKINVAISNTRSYIDSKMTGSENVVYTPVYFRFIEIQEFIKSFDELANRRNQLEKDLKDEAVRLEKAVAERTSQLKMQADELEKANKDLARINDVFVHREFRIKDLKMQIDALKTKLEDKKTKDER